MSEVNADLDGDAVSQASHISQASHTGVSSVIFIMRWSGLWSLWPFWLPLFDRSGVFIGEEQWRLTSRHRCISSLCLCVTLHFVTVLEWSKIIYSPCMSTHTPPFLSLPSILLVPPPPSSVFLSFLLKRKMNVFWGDHSSPVISLSLWLAVKKHLNAHQQNNSHFHACLHSGSSH